MLIKSLLYSETVEGQKTGLGTKINMMVRLGLRGQRKEIDISQGNRQVSWHPRSYPCSQNHPTFPLTPKAPTIKYFCSHYCLAHLSWVHVCLICFCLLALWGIHSCALSLASAPHPPPLTHILCLLCLVHRRQHSLEQTRNLSSQKELEVCG